MELVPQYNDHDGGSNRSDSPSQSKRRKGVSSSTSPSLPSASNANNNTSQHRNIAPHPRHSPNYNDTQPPQHSYHYPPSSSQGQPLPHPYHQLQTQQHGYSSNSSYPPPPSQQQQQQQHWPKRTSNSSSHPPQPSSSGIFRSQPPPNVQQERQMYSSAEPWPSNNSPDDKVVFSARGPMASTSHHINHSQPWIPGQQPHHGGPPPQQQHPQQHSGWGVHPGVPYGGPFGADIDSEEYDGKGKGNNMKGRGKYVCGKCGAPKKGHVCPYQPKLKRRADEPTPEMKNAAIQVEMDELMVLRRLNLEIQGFPESYSAGPLLQDNVLSDSYTYEQQGTSFNSSSPPFPLPMSSDIHTNNNIPKSSAPP